MKRRVHTSWLIAWFASGIIAGVACIPLAHQPLLIGPPWLIIAALLFVFAMLKRTSAAVVLILITGLVIGLWRGGSERLKTINYQPFIGQSVQLHGTIADDVVRKSGEAGLKLRNAQIGSMHLGGKVWAGAITSVNLKREDTVTLSGKLRPGFGNYAASLSYAQLVHVNRPAHGDVPRDIRDRFTDGLDKAVPSPQSDLGMGYLTGQHNTVPASLIKQLQLTGLIHLVIAGGYNVTILVRLVRRTLIKYSKYLATLGACLILLGLTLVAGFVAPMARTAVVTGLSLAAWYYGRRFHPFVLLPLAAAITAIVDPTFVWGDIGWYLTFIAYGGLIVLGPMLKQLFWPDNHHGELKQIMADTLSVQIVTTPLMAFSFQQYSLYGLPANLLVLPFMPLTMLATLLAGLGGLVLPAPAAHVAGWPANFLLGYTAKVTTWLASAPGAGAIASLNAPGMVLSYGFILFLVYCLWRKTGYDFRSSSLVE